MQTIQQIISKIEAKKESLNKDFKAYDKKKKANNAEINWVAGKNEAYDEAIDLIKKQSERTGLTIANIDFSDEVDIMRFSIEHDESSPICLWLNIESRYADGDERGKMQGTITLTAEQMKALGKALVFAGEYVETLY